jgi:hypothetical protein
MSWRMTSRRVDVKSSIEGKVSIFRHFRYRRVGTIEIAPITPHAAILLQKMGFPE